jgi:hypothetical protein
VEGRKIILAKWLLIVCGKYCYACLKFLGSPLELDLVLGGGGVSSCHGFLRLFSLEVFD